MLSKIGVFLGLVMMSWVSFAARPIYQAGTMLNLMHGVYEGSMTLQELAGHADLGLGTINGLGGELMMIDGHFYLADSQGSVQRLSGSQKTPYAITTTFAPQQHFVIHYIKTASQLTQALDQHVATNNVFYVFKVHGLFSHIKARSVVPPHKPYPSITEVVKTNQRVFDFKNMMGTLIIFKSPNYMSPITVPGYHMHFISDDRKHGGHVFDVSIDAATVLAQYSYDFLLAFPVTSAFAQTALDSVAAKDITAIESRHH